MYMAAEWWGLGALVSIAKTMEPSFRIPYIGPHRFSLSLPHPLRYAARSSAEVSFLSVFLCLPCYIFFPYPSLSLPHPTNIAMFSQRAVSYLFFLACLLAFASARPVRRSACPARAVSTATTSSKAPINVVKASTTAASASTTKASTKTSSTTKTTTTKASSSTKTSSTKAAASTSAPALSVSGTLARLFPVSGISKSWTTFPSTGSLALADSTFRPFDVLSSVVHTYTKAPDGKSAIMANYPKGSYTFGHNPQGGFSFYAPGPATVDLTTAKEATFGYSVFFPTGFDFNKGGKLPGLCACHPCLLRRLLIFP